MDTQHLLGFFVSSFIFMNYLAHFFLSNFDESLIVGNYIADDVKGKKYLIYPEEIQKGILLHRAIDGFTDNHITVEKSKSRIRPHQQKFTPVVVDVFYDYLLAINWQTYTSTALMDYAFYVYKVLQKNQEFLPEKSKFRLQFMIKQNWLYNYREIEGIKKALTGLSNRASFENKMNEAHILLIKNKEELNNDFNQFFPALMAFVKNTL